MTYKVFNFMNQNQSVETDDPYQIISLSLFDDFGKLCFYNGEASQLRYWAIENGFGYKEQI